MTNHCHEMKINKQINVRCQMVCDIGQSARATQNIYNSIWDTQTGGHKRCPKVLGKKLLRTFPIKIIC